MTSYFPEKDFPSALSIAGSDPSGGAGIQMDLKTFARTGVWGMAVITALTAQNAVRVSGSWAIEPDSGREQIATVLEDMTPEAIKTGMLANSKIIRVVEETLPLNVPLVIDPVMVSTSGHRLIHEDAIQDLRDILIPRATIVTPNIPEAQILAGMTILSEEDVVEAGKKILDLGTMQVIVKGGHGTGKDASDFLIRKNEVIRFTKPRLPYDVHGSGCGFSAAIAGYIAAGLDVTSACEKAKNLINRGIENAVQGNGRKKIINP